MSKFDFAKTFNTIKLGTKKHSPEILTGIGIVGMVATTVMAVKATPKALILIEKKKAELENDDIPPIEVVKATWKCYIPAAITGALSVTCLVGASSINARRNAAIAAAYTISESALKEYKDKVIETVGEKKEQEVRDAVAKDRIAKNPVHTHEVVLTGSGESLCYEPLSGRYFYSSADKIKKSVNYINDRLLKDNYVSLNDFYSELELDSSELGYRLGWCIDQGMIDISFSVQLATNDVPCLVLDYDRNPVYDYDKWL